MSTEQKTEDFGDGPWVAIDAAWVAGDAEPSEGRWRVEHIMPDSSMVIVDFYGPGRQQLAEEYAAFKNLMQGLNDLLENGSYPSFAQLGKLMANNGP